MFLGISHAHGKYTCHYISVCFSPVEHSLLWAGGAAAQAGTEKGRGDILPPLHKEWKLLSNRKEGTANLCRDVGESACMIHLKRPHTVGPRVHDALDKAQLRRW